MILAVYGVLALLALGFLLRYCEDYLPVLVILSGALLAALAVLPLGDARIGLLAALLALSFLAAAARPLAQDLRGIRLDLGPGRLRNLSLRAGLLWLPIGLLALGSLSLVGWRNAEICAEVYELEAAKFSEWNGACEKLVCAGDGPDMRRDLHAASDRTTATLEARIKARFEAPLQRIEGAGGDVTDAIMIEMFDGPFPAFPATFTAFSGIRIPSCNWFIAIFWPPEMQRCMKRMVLQPISSAYERMRDGLRADIAGALQDGQGSIEGGTEAVRAFVEARLAQELGAGNAIFKSGIDGIFLTGRVLGAISWVSLFMVVSKSYLIILARLVFDRHTGGAAVRLSRDTQHALEGSDITRTDGAFGYRIPLEEQVWYGHFSGLVRPDEYGRPTFPQPGRLFLRRLFAGKLRMQRFDPERFDAIGGQADFSVRFVRVNLAEGDRLCFRIRNLVAFTEGVQFGSVFNLKLAAMLQHRVFFPTATGRGSVVLRVDGGTMRLMPPDPPEGADPMDLAAFDMRGAFGLSAQHDFLSVYTEGYTVFPRDTTFVIRHAPDRLGRRGGKLLRKALFFLLPI